MDFAQLTTDALVEYVRQAPDVSPREFELIARLTGALDEIDLLTQLVGRLQTAEVGNDDSRG